MGAYLSVPTWQRHLESRYRLVIGECQVCGETMFPPEGACLACNTPNSLRPIEPTGTGQVIAHTTIENGVPPEFSQFTDAEGAIGVILVELDEGARLPGMLTDCEPDSISRGDRVEATVRRIYEQEGIVRYGAKFRPV